MRNKLILAGAFAMIASPVFAKESCRPAKDFVNMLQNFYDASPERINIIQPEVNMSIQGIDDNPDPSHMLYRYAGKDHILPVSDGQVGGLAAGAKWSKDGEICSVVEGDVGPETDDPTMELSVNFGFRYKRTDGVFPVEELREGAKDGSKIMKSLAPGGLGFVVPGLKTVAIAPTKAADMPPVSTFSRDGKAVAVNSWKLGDTEMFRLKDIKSSKADTLTIQGPYVMSATFKFDPEDIAKAEAERLAKDAESTSETEN